MTEFLKAPFPWFGGKTRAAELIWSRLGAVQNYVEPFAGSLAVLLRRPTEPAIETVNDLDCFIANFWRAIIHDAEGVAKWADGPVNEADLHARHLWLVHRADFRERMKVDPDFFDVKIAGWWVWGLSQWLGGAWCAEIKPTTYQKRPLLGHSQGVHQKTPAVTSRRRPVLIHQGQGLHQKAPAAPHRRRPNIANAGKSIHQTTAAVEPGKSRPHLNHRGNGVHQNRSTNLEQITDWFQALQDRMRRVRVCCGEWDRVLGKAPTTCNGMTGIVLDPPYSSEKRVDNIYSEESFTVAIKVAKWAIENGGNPLLRIALCGYEDEHNMPPDWECVPWHGPAGYANAENKNRKCERIWFSPACLKPELNLL